MTENTMPKNVLDDVMRSLSRSRPWKWFVNRWEKLFVGISIGAFSGMGICVILFNYVPWPKPQWAWWALSGLLFILTYYVNFTVRILVFSLPTLFRPEKSLVAPSVMAFDEEVDLIARLAGTYERHDLEYALDRVTLMATQLRSRLATTIGALDKVGVIPLAIAAFFSLRTLLKEQSPTSSELSWMMGAAIGLGIVYMSGVDLWGGRRG